MTRRVLVCGGRNFNDMARVFGWLDAVHAAAPITTLIQGGAAGADRLGLDWAKARGVPYLTFMADWKRYGRAAGPMRNAHMLTIGKPDLVVAFPGGSGTADMVRKAEAASVIVVKLAEKFQIWNFCSRIRQLS